MLTLLEPIASLISLKDGATHATTKSFDVLTIPRPKPGFYGVRLGDSVLMVAYKSAMSFRLKKCNLGFHKDINFFNLSKSFAPGLLDRYFLENLDNPYALQHVMQRIFRGDVEKPLTQFPPVVTPYPTAQARTEAIQRLVQNAKLGDLIFSRPIQESLFSGVIRQHDYCQFSHVGCYIGDGKTSDAGPSGVTENDLADTARHCHIASYRIRGPISEDQTSRMVAFAKAQKGKGYNWSGVFRLFVRKKLGLKSRVPSVSDLLFSDSIQLVDHV